MALRTEPPPAPRADGPGAGRTVRLRDGTPARIRPVGVDDRERLRAFLATVSEESLELRFFSAVRRERALEELLRPPHPPDEASLLLEVGPAATATVVAHGEYSRSARDRARAEVVFLVADPWHGQGAATLLLHRLAETAAGAGIGQFEAVVLFENQPMVDVFAGAGLPCWITWRNGEGYVLLDLRPPGTGRRAAPGQSPAPA